VSRAVLAAALGVTGVGSLLGISPTGSPLPTVPRAAAEPACPDIQVVFARGRDEAPGLGRVGNAFVTALRPLVGDQTVNAYAVEYPAAGVGDYGVGANDMSRALQQQFNACPASKLVVGGYSLGAASTDLVLGANIPAFGFNQPLPPAVGEKIAAVAVFGNGSQRLFGPLSTLVPPYATRSIELCNLGDPVCSKGNDRPAHSNYEATNLPTEAATFVAARVQAPPAT
jgi:cutinase